MTNNPLIITCAVVGAELTKEDTPFLPTAPDEIADAVKEEKPQILGLSALLTSTMMNMEDTMKALVATGVRDSVKVIIGGAPVSEDFAKKIGADGYGADGFHAVAMVEALNDSAKE